MSRYIPIGAVLLASFFASASPLMAQPAAFPATIGHTYSGALTVEVFPVQGGERVHSDTGTAEIRFEQAKDGQIAFSTTGMIESSGGFELSALLQQAPDGAWREAGSKGMTEINAAGRFLSISVVDGFEVTLTGMVSRQDGRLTLRRIPTAAITNADSEFAVVFFLDVEIPQVELAPAADADGAETTVGRGRWLQTGGVASGQQVEPV